MGFNSKISWTHHTFNPWIGCHKVAPGCDNCYAKDLHSRFHPEIDLWDVKRLPVATSTSNWKNPIKWNKKAAAIERRQLVFCGSLCDWADNRVNDNLRQSLWDLIRATPHLTWQLLTKRASNIEKFLPSDWSDGYDNVWLGVTVENRQHGIRRLDILRQIPSKLRFMSAEPLLEDLGDINLTNIQWCIVGGESGPKFRKMDLEWARKLKKQCHTYDVKFFFKQTGGTNKGIDVLDGLSYHDIPAY